MFLQTEIISPDINNADYIRWALTTLFGIVSLTTLILSSRQKHLKSTLDLLKAELEAHKEKAERLEEEDKKKVETIHRLEIDLADCRAKTDLTAMMKQSEAFQVKILDQFASQSNVLAGITATLSAIEKRLNGAH